MAQKFKERLLQGSGFSNKQFECDYGLKILQKMGWTQGNGLGKEEKGMTSCIQVQKREENLGLGVDKKSQFKWNDNWWENTFNDALKNIQIPKTNQTDSSETESESESESEQRARKKTKKADVTRKISGYSSSTERDPVPAPVPIKKPIAKPKKK